jgi:flagellar hook protein FlgE
MSINSALLSGVAGLVSNSAALGAISDNISNSNTVGYKQNSTEFEDLVTASAAAGSYNSGGVLASVSQLISEQGQLQQTSSPTDLAISGNGFFVVTPTAAGTAGGVTPQYTRAGSFTPNAQGDLVNTAGYFLQGWVADSQGVITSDPSDLTKLSSINVSNIGTIPNPSTEASLNLNLNSAQAVSTAASSGTYSAATPADSMAEYTATNGTSGVAPDYSTQVTIYDAKGGGHTFQIDFLKSSTANQWNAELVAVPASDVQNSPVDGSGNPTGLIASGVVAFNPDGTIDAAATTFGGTIAVGASTATSGVAWSTALGLPAQSVSLNLTGSPASVTQYDSASVTNSTSVDGGPAGTLTGVDVKTNGDVTASFSNGATKIIAEVPVATFTNYDGLASQSGNVFQQTIASGTATFQLAGQAGSGTIQSSALESSTVDLSTQFTGLITTQRAYEASSKIITTADQMLQSLIAEIQ